MAEDTLWFRFIWWLRSRVARPVLRRCSWCGSRLTNGDLTYGDHLGWGAIACESCIEYPDG